MKVLIAYGTNEGQTALIAEELRRYLELRGNNVTAVDLEHSKPDAAEFDRIVVAGSIHVGKYQKEVAEFVRRSVDRLNEVPSWFVGVSLSEAGGGQAGGHETAEGYIDAFVSQHGWHPAGTLSVAGALKYRDYNFVKRAMMKKIAGSSGGETDTSRNWEYTDWAAVGRLADEIAAMGAPA